MEFGEIHYSSFCHWSIKTPNASLTHKWALPFGNTIMTRLQWQNHLQEYYGLLLHEEVIAFILEIKELILIHLVAFVHFIMKKRATSIEHLVWISSGNRGHTVLNLRGLKNVGTRKYTHSYKQKHSSWMCNISKSRVVDQYSPYLSVIYK